MENWPIYVSIIMITALFFKPTAMVSICPFAALTVLVLAGSNGHELIARAAPNAVTVFVVMSTTQLAIRNILQAGAGDRISAWIAAIAAHRFLRRVPASILLPAIFVPAAMLLAMFLHNITAIVICVPLLLVLCEPYGVSPKVTLSAMLIASNLGGASMAFGDTPAILQRELWGFSPATFAMAMLPRNLVILALLSLAACLVTWWPVRHRKEDWAATLRRIKARNGLNTQNRYNTGDKRQMMVGFVGLIAFILMQFLFPKHALVSGCIVMAALILFIPREKHVEAYTTLGLEAIVIICSLFIVATAVEHTAFVHSLSEQLKTHASKGAIEITAYLLTTGISADGSAATLAPVVHDLSGGGLLSAWQLACGICAGSSTLLTAASAGPIINAVSKKAGHELSFRDYCRFGLPFSAVMVVIYLIMNALAKH